MSALARRIVASVRAKQAADEVNETTTNNVVEPDDGQSEAANKPIATTELAPAFDYASVLAECLPLLAEIAKLKTLEQKHFDNIPAQIAFERKCLAPNLPGDLVDGQFEEVPVAEAQLLPAAPSRGPVQSAVGLPTQPPSSAIEAAMSSTMAVPAMLPAVPEAV